MEAERSRCVYNVLTFLGLVINLIAACFFGYASGANQRAMFFYAGLGVFAAGFTFCGKSAADGEYVRSHFPVIHFTDGVTIRGDIGLKPVKGDLHQGATYCRAPSDHTTHRHSPTGRHH